MWRNTPIQKILLATALLVLGIFLLSTKTDAIQAQTSMWQASYWNNRSLTGEPVLERLESELNHNWGLGSPHPLVNADEFSVRWMRNIQLPSGQYRFTATTDDGMRVWIDDTPVIDAWYNSQPHSVSTDIFLLAGEHQIKVEYYEAGGEAVAKLRRLLLAQTSGDWLARYYDNMTLSGEPVLIQQVPQINFATTGSPAPEVSDDHFSISWTRAVPLDAGKYRFSLTADDGMRLWVNNQLIIDAWQNQSATTYTVEVDINGGAVPVRLEYYEDTGTAVAQFTWTRLTADPTPSPTPPLENWRGTYYNNILVEGVPVLVRDDAQIAFDWQTSSPAPTLMDADRFSVRWTRSLNLSSGQYQFTTRTDDGVRLWINGQLLIDQWQIQAPSAYSAVVAHPGGLMDIVMEYFENNGLAEAQLTWAQTSPIPLPDPNLPTATMTGASYLNVRFGPGLAFEPFTHLVNGQTVPLIGRDQRAVWLKIILPDTRTGWVSSRYLISDTPFVDLPIVRP